MKRTNSELRYVIFPAFFNLFILSYYGKIFSSVAGYSTPPSSFPFNTTDHSAASKWQNKNLQIDVKFSAISNFSQRGEVKVTAKSSLPTPQKANEKRESGWLAPLILGLYTKCELALSSGRFIAGELALGIH